MYSMLKGSEFTHICNQLQSSKKVEKYFILDRGLGTILIKTTTGRYAIRSFSYRDKSWKELTKQEAEVQCKNHWFAKYIAEL